MLAEPTATLAVTRAVPTRNADVRHFLSGPRPTRRLRGLEMRQTVIALSVCVFRPVGRRGMDRAEDPGFASVRGVKHSRTALSDSNSRTSVFHDVTPPYPVESAA